MHQPSASTAPDTSVLPEHPVSYKTAYQAAARFYTTPDGRHFVIRFSVGQRIEHFVLLASFCLLGVTGFSQAYLNTPIGHFILNLLGGLDPARQLHHFSAIILGILGIYHILFFLYRYIRTGYLPGIIPGTKDARQAVQMLKINIGIPGKYPAFDRYNFEQKMDYWILVTGMIILGITGLMQWLPIATAHFLPGMAIQVSRAIHKWQALVLIAVCLTWHMYHNVIKKINKSMFTGMLSLEEMQAEHPLELAYLEHAAASLKKPKQSVGPDLQAENPKKETQEPVMEDSEASFEAEPSMEIVPENPETEPALESITATAGDAQ